MVARVTEGEGGGAVGTGGPRGPRGDGTFRVFTACVSLFPVTCEASLVGKTGQRERRVSL